MIFIFYPSMISPLLRPLSQHKAGKMSDVDGLRRHTMPRTENREIGMTGQEVISILRLKEERRLARKKVSPYMPVPLSSLSVRRKSH